MLEREVNQFISRTLRKGGHRIQNSTKLSPIEVNRRAAGGGLYGNEIPPHADHQTA